MTSDLSPRVYTILSVLNDLKDAFLTLLLKPNKHPSLLMMYAFMDICAALSRKESVRSNKKVFTDFIEEFATVGRGSITPAQLWAARSAMLHTFSPLGHLTGTGKSKPIFYFSWTEKRDEIQRSLEERGYSDFSLLAVNDIKGLAIWAYNGMISRLETDSSFRARVIANAEHLLLDYNTYRVEGFLNYVATPQVNPPGK